MKSDLGISISVSAVVGGALSGLTNIGKAMDTLKSTTKTLSERQKELGKVLERNKDRLGVSSAKQLWQEYDKIGLAVSKLTQQYKKLNAVRAQREAVNSQWGDIKGQWQGALAAAGTLILPVKVSIEFESAMADVKKVVNFDTPQQFKEMERDILKMTRTIPMAGKDIAAIVAAGGQSGVSRENLTGFAEKAAKMGVAFDMAAGQAGESMATLSNVLQIPIPKIGTLGDAINHLSDNANSKAADIVNVLTRVGSDIKQLGMTENQGAAWGSTFLSMGKAPELAAQAMKGMITSMSVMKAGGAKKELAALGLTTKEFAAAMDKDANRAMLNLLDRVKQLPKAEQFPMLLKMFGQNYADDAMMLANNVGEYNRQLALLEERDASGNLKYLGSMQREFANRSATTANQIQIFKNGISELGIRLGSIVLPAVNAFLSKCIMLTSMISDWTEKHPVLTKGIVGTAASLLAFKVGMFGAMVIVNRARAGILALKGGLLSLKATAVLIRTVMQGGLALSDVPGTLGTVMRGFAAARTVIAGFGLSSLAALWPVVLAVAAVAAVAFVIYKYWKPLKAFFAGFWEGLTKGLEPLTPLFDAFVGTLSGIWTAVQPYLQPVLDWFGDFFNLTQAGEGNARSWGESVGSALASVVNTVVSVGTMIVDGWRMIFDGIFSLADSAWTQIKTAFDGGLLGILGLILNWSPIGAFYSAFASVLSWFGIDLPARFTEFGSNIIQGLWNGLQAKFEAVRAWLAEKAAALKNTFAGVMDIHSPSRVFRRFGGWMMEGLQIGINQGAPRPLNAIGGVASDLQQRFTNHTSSLAASMAANSAELSAARQGAAAAGGITVHFSPTIHAPGGNPQQIEAALQMGLQEFETMFRRMMDDKARRAY
ncbi:phage tail tape measure protein [Neisseria elongata]|jgi:phage tail tape measure protein, TP901 family|uniref:phage tail tape measure protein n=1 Tax=Neisseria elongata TaxID=495 RepID=UPI000D321D5B|nr:phage tail tape measure protein [Neisseria elongata]